MSLAPEARDRRRAALSLTDNPLPELDYVVTLDARISGLVVNTEEGGDAGLMIRYVPDGLIMEKSSLSTYLDIVDDADWTSLEEVAVVILDDLNNELVPRWVHVGVTGMQDHNGGQHNVIVEDRQPNWDNPGLLSRLKLA